MYKRQPVFFRFAVIPAELMVLRRRQYAVTFLAVLASCHSSLSFLFFPFFSGYISNILCPNVIHQRPEFVIFHMMGMKSAFFLYPLRLFIAFKISAPDRLKPVSYTHLDVYKRQTIGAIKKRSVWLPVLSSSPSFTRTVLPSVLISKNWPIICIVF